MAKVPATKKKSKIKAKRSAKVKKKRVRRVQHKETVRAKKILAQAKKSTTGLLAILEAVRVGAVGAPTDQQQDLLRATLVFAAAGLDSTLKELMRQSIPTLAMHDKGIREGLEKFSARKLRNEHRAKVDSESGYTFLAKVLASSPPIQKLTEAYVLELTGSSLQSTEQLINSAIALGVTPADMGIDAAELKPIFEARTKIVHELDVDLDSPAPRNQTPRTRDEMESWSNKLLEIAGALVEAVEKKL